MMEYCSPWSAAIFVIYSAFVIFAMMNIVTAFFVETALRVATEDKMGMMSKELWKVFHHHDHHGRQSTITEDEFFEHIDTPIMIDYLQKLELSPEQVRDSHFFQLLDVKDSGSIDRTELM